MNTRYNSRYNPHHRTDPTETGCGCVLMAIALQIVAAVLGSCGI